MSVYKLDHSETTGGYRYIDGIGLQASFFFLRVFFFAMY